MKSKLFYSFVIIISIIGFQTCEKSPTLEDFYKDQEAKKDSLAIKIPTSASLFQKEYIKEINKIRAKGCKCGEVEMPAVGPVVWSGELEAAGILHAMDMNKNDYFSHYSLDGASPGDRVSETGYVWLKVGENLEKGVASVEEILAAFVKSVNHCKVMMDGSYVELGIGVDGVYKVFDFAKPND